MKLKEFIEKLSQLDPELDVCVYAESPYEDYREYEDPCFEDPYGDYSNINVEVRDECLFIGG